QMTMVLGHFHHHDNHSLADFGALSHCCPGGCWRIFLPAIFRDFILYCSLTAVIRPRSLKPEVHIRCLLTYIPIKVVSRMLIMVTHGPVDPSILTTQRGIWAIKWSFVGLFATAVFQVVIVLLSGSVALLADTIHNFGDAVTAIPLWVAFTLERRKPSE